jgi:hypothetical protein
MRRWAAGLGCAALLAWAVPPGRAVEAPAFDRVQLKVPGRVMGVRAADFDGDGRRDLLVAAGRRLLWFRRGAEGFTAWADQVLAVPRGAIVADVWSPPTGPAQILLLDRKGVSRWGWKDTGFPAKPERWITVRTPWRAPRGAPLLVRPMVRDLTGDGSADLTVPVPGGFRIYTLGAPDAAPELHVQLTTDVATRVALLQQSRGGAMYAEAFHPWLWAGDADGDGAADLVVRERDAIALYLRDATGRLPRTPTRRLDRSSIPREKKPRFGRATGPMTVADVTGDGVLDFIQAIPGEGTILIFRGHALRRDFARPDAMIRTPGWALGALPRDLDGDGRRDLLVATVDKIGIMGALQIFVSKEVTVHSLLFYNRGAGGLTQFEGTPDDRRAITVPLAFTNTAQDGFSIGSGVIVTFDGDYDGDGRRDMLQRVAPGVLGIWDGRADRVYAEEPDHTVRIPSVESYRFVLPYVMELNGDGRSDLLLHYRDWEDQANTLVVLTSRTGK